MIENSKVLGNYLLERLEEIKARHPSVGDVRGKGLFAAIELVQDKETKKPMIPCKVEYYEKKHPLTGQLLGKLKEEGLYTNIRWNVLMICPPLCITKQELDWGLDRIDRALTIADDYRNGKGARTNG